MSRRPKNERQVLSRYLRDIRGFSVLTREHEQRLVDQIERGDAGAAACLVESNLSFVVKVASEYRSLGVPFEDLLNEGNLGLIEAARRFDRGKGTRFITYAVWWIRKRILEAVANGSVVRVPSHQRKKISALRKAEATLLIRLGRTPTREEIARYISVSVSEVDGLRRVHLTHVSLDRRVGEDESVPLSDLVADASASAEESLLRAESESLLARAFARLTPREQTVLRWRLALDGHTSLTLEQVGKRLDVSRERVRQIETEAKNRLRRFMTGSRQAPLRTKRRRA
jgi:RNA polymerase primary sigma factor